MLKYSHDEPKIKNDLFQMVGLVPTLKCDIQCRHCGIIAGPDRTKALDSDVVCRCLDEAKKIDSIKHICISGGEPFIHSDLLKFVKKAGKLFSNVVILTNCSWATSPDAAKRVLSPLAAAGLSMIGCSADDFHQEFIPIQYVRNAIAAAYICNMGASVQSCGHPKEPILGSELTKFKGKAWTKTGPVFSVGRAKNLDCPEMYSLDYLQYSGCIRGELYPIVVPSGRCYGCDLAAFRTRDRTHPLILGTVHDEHLNDILTRTRDDPLLSRLPSGGFMRLIDVIRTAGLAHKLKPSYNLVCDLCTHMLEDQDMRAALQKFYSGEQEPVHVVNGITVREFERAEIQSLMRRNKLNRRKRPAPRRHVDLIEPALGLIDVNLSRVNDSATFYKIVHLAFGPEWPEIVSLL
jgi:hypothetical protein